MALAAASTESIAPALTLQAVIGFGGSVPNGLKWHPDGRYIVYPLGSTVVVKDTATGKQIFLSGHTDRVTALAMSRDGRFVASGQRTNMGFKAPVIIWDLSIAVTTGDGAKALKHKLVLHKVAVQALDFSFDSSLLASLGGQDDNSLVVWDVASGAAICGSPAASHAALTVAWLNHRNDRLMTGGQYHLRSWDFQLERRRLLPEDAKVGSVKRIFTCIAIDDTDSFAYCGTSSGDLLQIDITHGHFVQASKSRFSLGIACATFVSDRAGGFIVIGTGDSALARLSCKSLEVAKVSELLGAVTSVSSSPDGTRAMVGTDQGNMYLADLATLTPKLQSTAHSSPIRDVCFPEGTSQLFLTAAGSDIRVWNSVKQTELLRIQVPGMKCLCITINVAGTSIVSGWDDGKIRAFAPETGKLQFAISDAHSEAVSAIAVTHDGKRIVSGGMDGRVRIWNVAGSAQIMEHSFKEHKKEVTTIRISAGDDTAVSSSADGSCLMWSLRRATRINALFAPTVFRSVMFHPDESQLLTTGSDRKITYWDASDCTAIRVMEGSTEEIMTLDAQSSGVMFASGGQDRLVKVWRYDEGDVVATGSGHSGAVNRVRIAPDSTILVSVGEEGAVFIWKMPPS